MYIIKKERWNHETNTPQKEHVLGGYFLAVLGFVGNFVALPFVFQFAFWFVVVGFVVLWLANAMKGF